MTRIRTFLIGLSVAAVVVGAIAMRGFAGTSSPLGSIAPGPSMLEPRSGHSAILLRDGRVLIVGGMRRNQDFYRSAELFDPAIGKFQAAGEMNVARVGQGAVLLKTGKVLVVGGWIGGGCTDSAELYDPATGKFSSVSPMTARRGRPSVTLLNNGDVLIAGGADRGNIPGGIASAELFHPAAMRFEAIASMHAGRISHTATLLQDGRVLIVGGRGESVTASAELYDPKTRLFTETGRLLTARYKHTAGLLRDGRVLIAGGSDERDWRGTLNSAEIYDPRTGRFTAVPAMGESRFKLPEEAVQLAFGQLLVAGGSRHAEKYDPLTGKFTAISGDLGEAWHFMTETRLGDGRALLTGGYANNDLATARTWIYQP